MVECCIFDLDGTLLSTLETITYHLNNTLFANGLEEITIDDTRAFIGNGARKLVSRAVAKSGVSDGEVIDRVLREYNEAYDGDPIPHTDYYPGVCELVDRLFDDGVKLAVVTNKPEITARKLIDHFFPGKFGIISGGKAGSVLKPDPTETYRVIELLSTRAEKTAFVGDTSVDIMTGKNAGVALCVGVSWGFRDREELLTSGADAIVDVASELYCELEKI